MKIVKSEISDPLALLRQLFAAVKNGAEFLLHRNRLNQISATALDKIITPFLEIEEKVNKIVKADKYIETDKMNLLKVRDLSRAYIATYYYRSGNYEQAEKYFELAHAFAYTFKMRLWFFQQTTADPKPLMEAAMGYRAEQDWSRWKILKDRLKCILKPIFSGLVYGPGSGAIWFLFFLPEKYRPQPIRAFICSHGTPNWSPCEQCIESRGMLGIRYLYENKVRIGKYLLEKSLGKGFAEIKLLKAICLSQGIGYPQDEKEALKILEELYKKTSVAPHSTSNFGIHPEYFAQVHFYLADLRQKVTQDDSEVEPLLKKAKAFGYVPLRFVTSNKPELETLEEQKLVSEVKTEIITTKEKEKASSEIKPEIKSDSIKDKILIGKARRAEKAQHAEKAQQKKSSNWLMSLFESCRRKPRAESIDELPSENLADTTQEPEDKSERMQSSKKTQRGSSQTKAKRGARIQQRKKPSVIKSKEANDRSKKNTLVLSLPPSCPPPQGGRNVVDVSPNKRSEDLIDVPFYEDTVKQELQATEHSLKETKICQWSS